MCGNNQSEMKSAIIDDLKKLIHVYELQLEELDYDETNNLFEFLGYPVTYQVLINVGSPLALFLVTAF